jgi:hypothetical protein
MFSFVTVNEYCSSEKCNDKIKNKLIGKKFKKIKEGHQNVWIKLPAPVQLATPATRVPVRPPTPATRHSLWRLRRAALFGVKLS